MKSLPSKTGQNRPATGEIEGLQRVLDQSYARFRASALSEWQRRHPHGDPSDACVRVRIGQSTPQQTLTG
jgi:hypothetical protein